MNADIPAPDVPPTRYLPTRPLPPYRFVPGLHPHPFRHADGHMYTDGSAPDEPEWDTAQSGLSDPFFLWGVDLFNHRYYWEAHEAWEAIWHQVERTDPRSQLFQGLIQAGAFALQRHRKKAGPSARLYRVSRERLTDVRERAGPVCYGVDLTATMAQLETFEAGGDWPVVVLAEHT